MQWREQYTPFGEEIQGIAANANQAGYTGHIRDDDTGLSYMQARYYDQVIGRLYSNDPVDAMGHISRGNPVHGFNRYTYANNNPYKYVDSDDDFPRPIADMARYRSMSQMQHAQQQIRQAKSHANNIVAPRDLGGVVFGGVGLVGSVGAGMTGIGTVPAACSLALSLDGIRSAWTGSRTMLGMGAEHTARAVGLDVKTVDAAGNAGDSITNMSGGPGAVNAIIKGTATAAHAATVVSTMREAADVIEERIEIIEVDKGRMK